MKTAREGAGNGVWWTGRTRLGRRRWLGLAAAATVTAAGCGPVTAARPRVAAPKIVLGAVLDIPASQTLGSLSERNQLYAQVLATFEAANRGIAVRVLPYTSTAVISASIIGGDGPDLFADTAPSYAGYIGQNLLLRLDGYFSRDNVDTSIWSSTVVDALQTAGGTFGINRGLDAYAFAVNLSLLDSLGLPYPSTDWTHGEFAGLAKQIAANVNGKQRYGASFQGGPGGFLGTLAEVTAGFGGAVTDDARTTQTLSAQPALAGVEWLLENLFFPSAGIDGTGPANLYAQTAGIQEIQQVQLLTDYQQWRDTFRWVLYPPPVYPRGRVGGAAANYWAISGNTGHPEAAWTLLRWMSTEAPYERLLMKAFLFPPSLNALMPEWEATAEAVAPGLKNRGLQWFTQSGDQGWGRAEPWFAYANNQAVAIDTAWWNRVLARSVGAQSALTQADGQVGALIRASAGQSTTLAQEVVAQKALSQRLDRMFAAGSAGTSSTAGG